jgi:uncharacterized LabA/DUF88 family protein
VTTHNTHQEQYDVDANVVEYSSTPESTTAPDASETGNAVFPAQAEASNGQSGVPSVNSMETEVQPEQALSPVAEPASADDAAPIEDEEQVQAVAPTVQEEEAAQHSTAFSASQNAQNIEEGESVASAEQPAPLSAEQETSEEASEDPAYPYTTDIPLAQIEAEVRPFTDFIEEFRQAEARLQASVQESETEVFHAFAPADVTPSEQEILPATSLLDDVSIPSSVLKSIDEARTETVMAFPQEGSALTAPSISLESDESQEPQNLQAQAAVEASESSAVNAVPEVQGEQAAPELSEDLSAARPAERAVSPLLRPPSARLRSARHASSRHPQREATPEMQPEAEQLPLSQGEDAAVLPVPSEEGEIPAAPAAAELEEKPIEEEKPRPARRYRFDRPASASINNNKLAVPPVPPVPPVRSEEHAVTPAPAVRSENAIAPVDSNSDTTAKSNVSPVPQVEQNMKSLAVEAPAAESANGTASIVQEHSRRRQSHERNKEQAAPPVPAPEASTAPAETPTKAREVAPEDLPPLEYAELQKSTSRRRRRHRSSSSNGVTAPVVQNGATAAPAANGQPVETTTPQPAPAPATPPSQPTQYTIVSGYTVNQMNMGNETSGPFMAPEPSPARGSIVSRDGRVASRAEVQRAPAPTYPHVRAAAETGLTSTALNHFTNTIAQAIQTQTDRMVAELHRVTQTPANISVTLPPFPSNERVGVFVDVANLLYSARTLNLSVDFGKLLDFLRGNRRLIRAHAYCPTSPQPGAEQMFLQAVKGLGYRITTKHYKTFSSGAKKADLDLDLCMDVVRLVDGRAVDCIVLVSGDSDFMPMLDYCSDHGVRVEVAAFDEAMSATLRQSCDLFINLSMLDEVLVHA